MNKPSSKNIMNAQLASTAKMATLTQMNCALAAGNKSTSLCQYGEGGREARKQGPIVHDQRPFTKIWKNKL
jgi:hypothetical protein